MNLMRVKKSFLLGGQPLPVGTYVEVINTEWESEFMLSHVFTYLIVLGTRHTLFKPEDVVEHLEPLDEINEA